MRWRGGAWVAQSVKCLTLISAQVMISQFMNSSPTLGSLLSAQSLLCILDLPLSLCPSSALSQKYISIKKFLRIKIKIKYKCYGKTVFILPQIR